MDKQYLLNKGYKEFDPSQLDPDGVITMYQKRFTDERGTKYFITAREWNEMLRSASPLYQFDFDIYLTAKSNDRPICLNFYAGWTVDEVEKYIEDIWNTGIYEYYEVKDNEED